MKTFITLITTLVTVNAFAGNTKTTRNSLYTDLNKDCVAVSSATTEAPIDFYAAECKAFGGYRLTITGGDLRYHPELYFGDTKIEIETPMSFHDTASTKVEWAYTHTIDNEGVGTLEWKALIYRLNSVDSEDPNRNSDILYVVRLNGKNSCLLGQVKTNAEARALAYDAKAICK